VHQTFLDICKQILNGGTEASAVQNVHKVTLVNLAKSKPNLFLSAFKSFIERLLILEADDAYQRNFFRLVDKLFNAFFSSKAMEKSKYPFFNHQYRWATDAQISPQVSAGDVRTTKNSS